MYIPSDDGQWIDENFSRLAEVVSDYNPHLKLCWIPPSKRTDPEDELNPYCIIDMTTNTIVMYASFTDTPVDILENLFKADNSKGNVLNRLDARNAASKLLEYRKWMDNLDDAAELATFMIKSPKNYMKMYDSTGVLIKLDDQRRRMT